MSKKKKNKGKSEEPELPKFGGFHPLEGLKTFKDKLKEEEAKARTEPAKPKPAERPRPVEKRTAQSAKEDELSFHRLMSGVTPLDAKAARVPMSGEPRGPSRPRPADLREKARAEAAQVIDHLRTLVDDTARFEVTDDGNHVEGRRVDAPPGLLRDLRHGRLPIDGRVDLHGLGVDDARARVLEFLRQMRTRGERCVLVIHGKGEGVLRGEIAAWLSQGKAREHVAAFATATDRDGGEGALYVALRRK